MSSDTPWDIEKYKYDSDLDHHWELKKKFILAHINEYPERRLACLAQILCNIHFLGCSYGDDVTELVRELSEGVLGSNEPFDKAKHQTGFASASGAIADKVKAFGRPQEQFNAPNQQYSLGQQSFRPPSWQTSQSHNFQGGNYNPRPRYQQNQTRQARMDDHHSSRRGITKTKLDYATRFVKEGHSGSEGSSKSDSTLQHSTRWSPSTAHPTSSNPSFSLNPSDNPSTSIGSTESIGAEPPVNKKRSQDHPLSPFKDAQRDTGHESAEPAAKKLDCKDQSFELFDPNEVRNISSQKDDQKTYSLQEVEHDHDKLSDGPAVEGGDSGYSHKTKVDHEAHEDDLKPSELAVKQELTPGTQKMSQDVQESSKEDAFKWPSDDHFSKLIPDDLDHLNPFVSNFENKWVDEKTASKYIDKIVGSGPLAKIVILETITSHEPPINVLDRSVGAAGVKRTFTFTNKGRCTSCDVRLNGIFIAQKTMDTKKLAKIEATKLALSRLRQISFSILIKASFLSSSTIGKSLEKESLSDGGCSVDTPLSQDNIGSKMMKLMGWSGGGLGKDSQGIAEPVKAVEGYSITKKGLGSQDGDKFFKSKIMKVLREFKYSNKDEDLVFSKEFTKEDRVVIHESVRRLGLKSRSYGKEGEERRIVVCRKVSPLEIVKDLLMRGGETEKYKLLHPLCAE